MALFESLFLKVNSCHKVYLLQTLFLLGKIQFCCKVQKDSQASQVTEKTVDLVVLE